MQLKVETKDIQSAVAMMCRTGDEQEISGARHDRLRVYRRLVKNIVDDALRTAYPITMRALGQERWEKLVQCFLEEHSAQSPHVWEMPKELLQWYRSSGYQKEFGAEYLEDLLSFEWIEIEMYMMPDLPKPRYKRDGHVLEEPLVLNPEYKILHFQYPVFNTAPEELIANRGEYFVLAFRSPENFAIRFVQLSPMFVLVIELLGIEPMAGYDALELVGEQFGLEKSPALIEKGRAFIQNLLEDGAILGFTQEFSKDE